MRSQPHNIMAIILNKYISGIFLVPEVLFHKAFIYISESLKQNLSHSKPRKYNSFNNSTGKPLKRNPNYLSHPLTSKTQREPIRWGSCRAREPWGTWLCVRGGRRGCGKTAHGVPARSAWTKLECFCQISSQHQIHTLLHNNITNYT